VQKTRADEVDWEKSLKKIQQLNQDVEELDKKAAELRDSMQCDSENMRMAKRKGDKKPLENIDSEKLEAFHEKIEDMDELRDKRRQICFESIKIYKDTKEQFNKRIAQIESDLANESISESQKSELEQSLRETEQNMAKFEDSCKELKDSWRADMKHRAGRMREGNPFSSSPEADGEPPLKRMRREDGERYRSGLGPDEKVSGEKPPRHPFDENFEKNKKDMKLQLDEMQKRIDEQDKIIQELKENLEKKKK